MKHLSTCATIVVVACGAGQPEPVAPAGGESGAAEVVVSETAAEQPDAAEPGPSPLGEEMPAPASVEPGPEDCWAVGDIKDVPWKDGKDIRALTFDEPACGEELDKVVSHDFGGPTAVRARLRQLRQRSPKQGGPQKLSLRCRTENYWTLLHLSAMQGNRGVSEVLIENGADVRACDMNGMTPLHYAAQDGHVAVVELLLDKGAYVDAVNIGGERPLHEAVQLLPIKPDQQADAEEKERYAAFHRVIELLIEGGATLDAPNGRGNTVLHMAASDGNLDVVRLLVERGASLRVKDSQGRTPEDVAKEPEVAAWLRRRLRARD